MDQNLDFHITRNIFGTHMHWIMICKKILLINLIDLSKNVVMQIGLCFPHAA